MEISVLKRTRCHLIFLLTASYNTLIIIIIMVVQMTPLPSLYFNDVVHTVYSSTQYLHNSRQNIRWMLPASG